MLRHAKSYLSLFILTLFLTLGIHSGNSWQGKSAIAISQPSANSQTLISKKRSRTSTRKSGGRSSGGSFKTRTKTKPTPKPRNSSTSPNSRSGSKSSNTRKTTRPTTPTYRDRPLDRTRNRDYYEPEPYYPETRYRRRSRTYGSYGNSRGVHPFLRLLGWLLLFLLIFIPLFILFKFLGRRFSPENRAKRKVDREITNDIVTISLVQVALSAATTEIQRALSELSLQADTDTPEGLLSLMRDVSLVLTRNSEAWTHVLAHSESTNINQAESIFEALSLKQRTKFSDESLSNVNGTIETKVNHDSQISSQVDFADFADHVVVTLILGTADDQPLFAKITDEQELETTLLKLAAMDEAYLFKFELLWTPQTEGVYLSEEELLLQYSEMLPLI